MIHINTFKSNIHGYDNCLIIGQPDVCENKITSLKLTSKFPIRYMFNKERLFASDVSIADKVNTRIEYIADQNVVHSC